MPDQAAADAEQAADRRHVTFHHDQVSFDGTTLVRGRARPRRRPRPRRRHHRAAPSRSAAAGCTELPRRAPRHGRRRPRPPPARPRPRPSRRPTDAAPRAAHAPAARKPRQVVLYVHLSEAAITGTTGRWPGAGAGGEPPPRRHRRPGPHLVRQPRHPAWSSSRSSTSTSTSHRPPTRSPTGSPNRPTCATAPASSPGAPAPPARCDIDHVIPHADGGTTCTLQHRPPVPTTSPAQDPHALDLHRPRTRHLPVVQPPRLPVPPRPPRHPRRQPRPTTTTSTRTDPPPES